MHDAWDKKTLGELREHGIRRTNVLYKDSLGFSVGKRYQILTAYIDLVKYIHDRELKLENDHA